MIDTRTIGIDIDSIRGKDSLFTQILLKIYIKESLNIYISISTIYLSIFIGE